MQPQLQGRNHAHGRPFQYAPIRHEPFPELNEGSRPELRYSFAAVAAIAASVWTWRETDSMTLVAFWALTAGYVVATAFDAESGVGRLTRLAIVGVAVGSAIGWLAYLTSEWGNSWEAAAASLVAGTAVHTVLAWLFGPALLRPDH